jgi:transcriptional regulator with XRE-family HTH domain
MTKTVDGLKMLACLAGKDAGYEEWAERETLNIEVAGLIFDAREQARLTQSELARRIGSHQPVIARLESAAYRGHSLALLKRIARALGKRVEIRLVPDTKRRSAHRSNAPSRTTRGRTAR